MGMKLPAADWRARAGVRAIVAALGHGQARFVGGAVRDTLAGLAVKDVDLATPLPPETVIARLEAAAIKAVPTGLAHGTITAVSAHDHVEITTLRHDVSTDGRRATVAFTDDWQADAARRDFTINALYADPESGAIFDYFGGIADLDAGRVRFIGAPLERIAEDHLRILRFFRFQARFGRGAPDRESLAACVARANDLMALSRERIAAELLALLALADPAPTIALMQQHAIFAPVLPELVESQALATLIARETTQAVAPDPLRRLAALLPPDPVLAETIANRLRLSKAQRKRLMIAAARGDDDASDPRALAYWLGAEGAIDRLLLGRGDARALIGWTPPRFPLTGGAVVARGISAGPAVAALLKTAERQWVDEGFPDTARATAILNALCAG